MKHEVKFAAPGGMNWSWSPRLEFHGKGAVHLHETGLVLEGNWPRFTIPLIGRFYAPLLCAPTSRTIPFSRISRIRYSGHWVACSWFKLVLLTALGVLPVSGTIVALMAQDLASPVLLVIYWGLYALVVGLLLVHGRRTHALAYRLPTGRTQRVAFRLRRATRSAATAFSAEVQRFVATAAAVQRERKTEGEPSRRRQACELGARVALVFALAAGAVRGADGDTYHQALAAARRARAERKTDEAVRLAQHAIAAAATLPADDQAAAMGEAGNLLGLIHWEADQSAAAVAAFERALAAHEQAGERTRADQATTLYNLAVVYTKQQQFERAASAYQRRLVLRAAQVGADSPELIADLDRLAGAYLAQQRYAEVEATLRRMRDIHEKTAGPQSEPVAQVLDALAGTLEKQERHADAEPLYRQSLAIRRQLRGDSAHEDVINSLFRLADNRRLAGDLPAAQDLFQQTDERLRKRYGPDAEQRRQTLQLRREVARQLADAAAQARCEQELERLDAIARWLGTAPQPQGGLDPAQAAAAEQEWARFVEAARAFGQPSQPVFTALYKAGRWQQLQERHPQALRLFEQALDVGRSVHGEHHPETAAIRLLQAESQRALGQRAEAATSYGQALAANEQSGFPDTTIELKILLRSAQLPFEGQQYANALPLYERYLRFHKLTGAPRNPELGLAMNQLAVCYTGLARWQEALPLFQEAVGVLEQHLPADAPLLATVRQNVEVARGRVPSPRPLTGAALAAESARITPGAPLELQPPAIGADPPPVAGADPPIGKMATAAVVTLLVGLFISRRAAQRGYRSLTWFVAFLVSCSTPILTACLLATLPDRRRELRREELRRRLEQELQTNGAASRALPPQTAQGGSLGDEETQT